MWLICFTIVNMLHHRQDSDNVNPEVFFFFFFHMAWELNITVGNSRVFILWHADPSAKSTIKVRSLTNDSNYPRLHLRSKIFGDPKQTPWCRLSTGSACNSIQIQKSSPAAKFHLHQLYKYSFFISCPQPRSHPWSNTHLQTAHFKHQQNSLC